MKKTIRIKYSKEVYEEVCASTYIVSRCVRVHTITIVVS